MAQGPSPRRGSRRATRRGGLLAGSALVVALAGMLLLKLGWGAALAGYAAGVVVLTGLLLVLARRP